MQAIVCHFSHDISVQETTSPRSAACACAFHTNINTHASNYPAIFRSFQWNVKVLRECGRQCGKISRIWNLESSLFKHKPAKVCRQVLMPMKAPTKIMLCQRITEVNSSQCLNISSSFIFGMSLPEVDKLCRSLFFPVLCT